MASCGGASDQSKAAAWAWLQRSTVLRTGASAAAPPPLSMAAPPSPPPPSSNYNVKQQQQQQHPFQSHTITYDPLFNHYSHPSLHRHRRHNCFSPTPSRFKLPPDPSHNHHSNRSSTESNQFRRSISADSNGSNDPMGTYTSSDMDSQRLSSSPNLIAGTTMLIQQAWDKYNCGSSLFDCFELVAMAKNLKLDDGICSESIFLQLAQQTTTDDQDPAAISESSIHQINQNQICFDGHSASDAASPQHNKDLYVAPAPPISSSAAAAAAAAASVLFDDLELVSTAKKLEENDLMLDFDGVASATNLLHLTPQQQQLRPKDIDFDGAAIKATPSTPTNNQSGADSRHQRRHSQSSSFFDASDLVSSWSDHDDDQLRSTPSVDRYWSSRNQPSPINLDGDTEPSGDRNGSGDRAAAAANSNWNQVYFADGFHQRGSDGRHMRESEFAIEEEKEADWDVAQRLSPVAVAAAAALDRRRLATDTLFCRSRSSIDGVAEDDHYGARPAKYGGFASRSISACKCVGGGGGGGEHRIHDSTICIKNNSCLHKSMAAAAPPPQSQKQQQVYRCCSIGVNEESVRMSTATPLSSISNYCCKANCDINVHDPAAASTPKSASNYVVEEMQKMKSSTEAEAAAAAAKMPPAKASTAAARIRKAMKAISMKSMRGLLQLKGKRWSSSILSYASDGGFHSSVGGESVGATSDDDGSSSYCSDYHIHNYNSPYDPRRSARSGGGGGGDRHINIHHIHHHHIHYPLLGSAADGHGAAAAEDVQEFQLRLPEANSAAPANYYKWKGLYAGDPDQQKLLGNGAAAAVARGVAPPLEHNCGGAAGCRARQAPYERHSLQSTNRLLSAYVIAQPSGGGGGG